MTMAQMVGIDIDPDTHGKEGLDREEVVAFCRFAFESLRNPNITKKQEAALATMAIKHITSKLGSSTDVGNNNEVSPTISSDMFMEAVTSIERFRFQTLIQLFDADRQMSCLEKFFMPRYLKKIINRENLRAQEDLPEHYQISHKEVKDFTHTKDHVEQLMVRCEMIESKLEGDIREAEVVDQRLNQEIARIEADISDMKGVVDKAHEAQVQLQNSASQVKELLARPKERPEQPRSEIQDALDLLQRLQGEISRQGKSLKDVAESQWRLSLRLEEHIMVTSPKTKEKGEGKETKLKDGDRPAASRSSNLFSFTRSRSTGPAEANRSLGDDSVVPQESKERSKKDE